MVAQLAQRPSRVERQRIDRRVENYDNDRRKISEVYKGIDIKNIKISKKDLNNFFKEAGGIINGNFKKRVQPAIPFIALYLALVKDLLDYAALSGIALLVTIPVSIIASGGLIYWTWGKTSFRAWKEKIIRWLIISVIIELTPYVNFIPTTVILVIIIHLNETKMVRLINLTIDYLEKGGRLD